MLLNREIIYLTMATACLDLDYNLIVNDEEIELFILVEAFEDGIIDEEEFLLLYRGIVSKTKKNPRYQYWNYQFDFDSMNNDECKAEFRFEKSGIHRICATLGIGDVIVTYNRHVIPSLEALCIFLRRFAYPSRLSDMVPRFGRSVPMLSIIFSHMLNFIYNRYKHLLSSLNQSWLSQQNLEMFALTVYQKSGALKNCWGFIDGTVRDCCRPGEFQKVMYNGHHRVHGLKFQSVTCPNGLIANFFGPVEGKRHDSSLLAESQLLQKLEEVSFSSDDGTPLCIYGDPA